MWRRRVRELFTAPSPAAPTAALRQPPSLQRGLRPHGGEAVLQTFAADLLRRLQLPCVAEPPTVAGTGRRLSSSWRLYSAAVSPDDGGGASAASAGCWNCGAAPPSSSSEAFLVCAACGSVQPVDSSVDFFKIFGLEKEYELRGDDLEGKYKNWQKKLHPDLVHTKSERERSYAADQSARVIDAFKTLSAPLSRAIYMLQLEGLHVDEEGTVSDPDLLAEVMELREAVEEAKDSQTLEQIKSSCQEKLELWSRSFEGACKGRRFKDATASIQRMTYYQRAIEEIVKKL
ncbi:unnamed protein product [Spirodela intermedia]|uniref:J domain-containing protein n=1 Tax=Spirodela intermedia TaxID=51605 RepID=A0A7I8KB38_SPIIN|nr:unnamed protein product [Spirodela intermedia]